MGRLSSLPRVSVLPLMAAEGRPLPLVQVLHLVALELIAVCQRAARVLRRRSQLALAMRVRVVRVMLAGRTLPLEAAMRLRLVRVTLLSMRVEERLPLVAAGQLRLRGLWARARVTRMLLGMRRLHRLWTGILLGRALRRMPL